MEKKSYSFYTLNHRHTRNAAGGFVLFSSHHALSSRGLGSSSSGPAPSALTAPRPVGSHSACGSGRSCLALPSDPETFLVGFLPVLTISLHTFQEAVSALSVLSTVNAYIRSLVSYP